MSQGSALSTNADEAVMRDADFNGLVPRRLRLPTRAFNATTSGVHNRQPTAGLELSLSAWAAREVEQKLTAA